MFKKLNGKNFCSVLIGLTALVGSNLANAGCGQNINEGIQKIIDEGRVKYHIPGLEVSVSCPGEDSPRDFVSGTTTIDGVVSVQSNSLFQIGSETKSFVSAIILQLEAEGQLSIADPIGKYLQNIPASWQDITIQQLLNHTSGLFNYTAVPDVWGEEALSGFQKQWTADELVNLVFDNKLNFLSGQGWDYSNTNYVLAGMLIQAVTGQSLENEINNRLLIPLQLSHTYYLPHFYSDDILQQMARGYSKTGLFIDEPKDITNMNMSWANAAGAIVSTSHDTAIWLRSLLTSSALLPHTQRQELMNTVDVTNGQTLSRPSPNVGYGLGIMAFDSPFGEIWGHGGGTLGYISNMFWLQRNDVVLTIIVNQADKDEIDGAGSQVILMELINLIQQSDTTKQNQRTQKLGHPAVLLKQLEQLIPVDELIKRSY